MSTQKLSIRKQTLEDIPLIVDYFLNSTDDHLLKMGVERTKLYERTYWLNLLQENFYLNKEKKQLYYIIWLMNDEAIGHCNINKIIPNQEANMHLHLWNNDNRHKGLGLSFLQMSIPIFFKEFNLKKLYCEPYASNPAPNKTLEKLGFEFIDTYFGIPGPFNFEQQVNKWCLTKEKMNKIIQ